MQRPNHRQPEFEVAIAPELASAWKYSAERFRQIDAAIGECLPEFVACVAVSGSLARMEAHARSDIDLIIVVDDRHAPVSESEANAVFGHVWDRLDAEGTVRPKPGGVFSVCARWKDIVDPTSKGRIDESIVTFGHRIQLLMDAQPVLSELRFIELQKDILEWYSETHLASIFDEPGPFHWLWQDVHRYWRSLRSRTCWLHADDAAKSLALNVKLRSSRLMLVFAFLGTLRQSWNSKRTLDEVIDGIVVSLHGTPAERLFGSNEAIGSWNTVWNFLRATVHRPTSDLTDDVRYALAQLVTTIEGMIENASEDSQRRQWLM